MSSTTNTTSANNKKPLPFDLWPFAFTTATPDVAASEARKLARDMLATPSGRCVSAMLADAYQCPPTPANVAARAAWVNEMAALAAAGLATTYQDLATDDAPAHTAEQRHCSNEAHHE